MRWLQRLNSAAAEASVAERIDHVFAVTLWLCLAVFLLLVGSLAYAWFSSKHRASSQEQHATPGTLGLVLWVSFSSVVVAALFWMGFTTYLDASIAPGDAYDIQTLSENGVWKFTYPTGKVSKGELVVPAGKAIRLILSSKDIPHGLYIPKLRLQQLAIPGRYTTLWFKIRSQQSMGLKCTEGCPRNKLPEPSLLALSESRFEAWLASNERRVAATTGGR